MCIFFYQLLEIKYNKFFINKCKINAARVPDAKTSFKKEWS